jgi:tagatose kinase
MSLDILTFGEALVEVMRTGHDQPLDRAGTFSGPYPSGAPFIFAAQAARLGAHVTAVGCVGDDAFGHCLRNQLSQDGVDPRGLHVLTSHATGVAFIAYNYDGSRDFVFHVAQAAAGQVTPNMLEESLFDRLGCLHISGSSLSINENALKTGLRALKLAQKAGAKISFDPNLRPQLMPAERAREAFQPFIAAADVILPTAQEVLVLTGISNLNAAVSPWLMAKHIVVVTDGANGCTAFTQVGAQHIPGFIIREVDPTGAGDAFNAGFLLRWLNGDSLADAAYFANACGAMAAMEWGPMAGAKSAEAVQAFISGYEIVG